MFRAAVVDDGRNGLDSGRNAMINIDDLGALKRGCALYQIKEPHAVGAARGDIDGDHVSVVKHFVETKNTHASIPPDALVQVDGILGDFSVRF